MKYRIFPVGINVENTYDYPKLIVEQVLTGKEYLSVFRNKKEANTALFQLIDKFGLCMQKNNLIKFEGVCYNYETKKFNGACMAKENPKKYNLKVKNKYVNKESGEIIDTHTVQNAIQNNPNRD